LNLFKLPPVSLDTIIAAVGTEVAVSPWRTVTQEMIDRFADATDDHQFIHVDPARAAAETAFGGTIAHGFLTLSLLSTMAYESIHPLENVELNVNQGFENMRFMAPVKTGSRVRARFFLVKVKPRPSGWIEFAYDVTMDIENTIKPALKLHWLTLSKIDRSGSAT
jgi:acyl dehydratase